ncbi:hypothetical protein NEFER03_0345 [Nematocida sp. LUAm3]|nr:hypothetical protein NEFER03_0345 [Nematocida sp. LUAm3]KAI5175967.1 hypothetical protein NEFER02_1813 [Nematocida sp. LUAm2]KAI5179063.1 hypothetical protein NEFER01_1930 [Nematocida sp. LUAm1]
MEERKKELAEEGERMSTLKRSIGSLKSMSEELDRKINEDLHALDERKKETEFVISRLDRTIRQIKRASNDSFTLILVTVIIGLGLLLFLGFLFR